MESPSHLARRIPKETWKTVTDAWNGYHSVPLRESDRHLTTFITPFGRWRYLRAPQGFLSSGYGYNRRFDAVLSAFVRKARFPLTYFAAAGEKFRHRKSTFVVLSRRQRKVKHKLKILSNCSRRTNFFSGE
jgi:hypothetical protein